MPRQQDPVWLQFAPPLRLRPSGSLSAQLCPENRTRGLQHQSHEIRPGKGSPVPNTSCRIALESKLNPCDAPAIGRQPPSGPTRHPSPQSSVTQLSMRSLHDGILSGQYPEVAKRRSALPANFCCSITCSLPSPTISLRAPTPRAKARIRSLPIH